MTKEMTEREEAIRLMSSRIADFQNFNKLSDDWEDKPTKADEKTLDELGRPDEYGLDLSRLSYNFRNESTTWVFLLSTGGPHDEFQVEADRYGTVEDVTFVYLPWFGRQELDVTGTDFEAIKEYMERFHYLESDTFQ